MGIADADTAENEVSTATHIITPIACAVPPAAASGPKLSGGNFVEIQPGTLLAQLYGTDGSDEQFFCNYGVNAEFEARLEAAGAIINARGTDGQVRGFEIPGHVFFLATLFQPQLTSVATGEPHPVMAGYLKAVAVRAASAGPSS